MSQLTEQLKETCAYLQAQYAGKPVAGIILGSGLGQLVDDIAIEKEIPYTEIPHFPVSTVAGHSGRLIFGKLGGKTVVAMSGRFHYYEGYSPQQVTYPVRVMKALGIENLLLSNAAGGVNRGFKVGDLMIITDHVSFFTVNPLIGKNEEELGPRFPDMSEPYKKHLIQKAETIAAEQGIELKKGVYLGLTGPSYETRAEYKLALALGCDTVGMSTVQEVIVAAHMALPVFGVSLVTNIGIRDDDNAVTHEEVLEAGRDAGAKLGKLFQALVAAL